MAEYNSTKKQKREDALIPATNVLTGDESPNRQLLYQLKQSIKKAEGIDIIVSFLMESGVKVLLNELIEAANRNIPIRILTGNYLGITQPSALYLLKKELGDKIDLRFYNDKSRSFHPKSYIFHQKNKNEIYIGSSNLSLSALTKGIEWNYKFDDKRDKSSYEDFYSTFTDLFENHSVIIDEEQLQQYSKSWHRPAVYRDLEKLQEKSSGEIIPFFEPRGMQIEALYALENTRREGATKALIQAATGVGKTYLAAFDSKEAPRVLFIAHREEILNQAARSFMNVRDSDDFGFFDGKNKDTTQSVIFASVSTLGKEKYLKKYFKPTDFDYIIIDEFHHAVTKSYQSVIDYFRPKFLLGLTATPKRLDGRNIYEICDYNVPYQIGLTEAINKGILVPFHYYGIYDETDYSKLRVSKGHYSEKQLDKSYIGNIKRDNLIIKNYLKHHSVKALGFCSSRAHAESMAEVFSSRGIPAAAVYSNAQGKYSKDRSEAIAELEEGKIKVIFSVDMFNEGVDIPDVDLVMFLRPTESSTVFFQQLGRGLRKSKGKDFLTVLDFIGNYQKAEMIPNLLREGGLGQRDLENPGSLAEYPDNCIVDFDLELIDLFEEVNKRNRSFQTLIEEEYYRVKEYLHGKRPMRMDFFSLMDKKLYARILQDPSHNPFRDYLGFLKSLDELDTEEEKLYNTLARDFFIELETTLMRKSYKMPVLLSFYNNGNIRMDITDKDLLNTWKNFYSSGENWRDLNHVETSKDYFQISDKKHLQNIKRNPVNYLKESKSGFFTSKAPYTISLYEKLGSFIDNPSFKEHMKDIINYRITEYYNRRYQQNAFLI